MIDSRDLKSDDLSEEFHGIPSWSNRFAVLTSRLHKLCTHLLNGMQISLVKTKCVLLEL